MQIPFGLFSLLLCLSEWSLASQVISSVICAETMKYHVDAPVEVSCAKQGNKVDTR